MSHSQKNATIYDVAIKANVSIATASRVINGIDKVTAETKQRVLDAIKELNFKPNAMAKDLASRKTTDVAIIVPVLNYTYISHVVAGLMDSATEYGYDCRIYTTGRTKEDMENTIEKVLSHRVNGVIVFNDHLGDDELGELLSFDLPIVTLGTDLKTVSSVTWHYKDQIRSIVTNSLVNNKQEVYFLKVENGGIIEKRCLNAIIEAYNSIDRNFTNIIKVPDSYKDTYKIMLEYFTQKKNGLYITSRDSIALAVLNAAKDLNLEIPEDVEVTSVIGTKYSELSRPKLSSFDIDMRGFGKKGMEVLAKLIKNNEKVYSIKLPFEFIKRGSTK